MIRRMNARDIPAAMCLKEAAGWNQTTNDWERVLRLDREACFVDERGGHVIGTTSAVRLGADLGWVGMVLVLPRMRRRGIARGLLQHALSGCLSGRGSPRIWGLDATDMARPLYEQSGFQAQEVIERWQRPAEGATAVDRPDQPERGHWPGSMQAIDRRAYGCDRSALLRDLWRDPTVEAITDRSGFAFGRPGSSAWFLGPCVGLEPRPMEAMVRGLLSRHGHERIFWDLLASSTTARDMARRNGFRPVRRLTRMLLAEDPARRCPSDADLVFATPGFEFA